jgi:hypothetical protein
MLKLSCEMQWNYVIIFHSYVSFNIFCLNLNGSTYHGSYQYIQMDLEVQILSLKMNEYQYYVCEGDLP